MAAEDSHLIESQWRLQQPAEKEDEKANFPDTQVYPDSDQMPCLKCGSDTSIVDGGVLKGNGLHCRECHNIYQCLYRHLGGIPPGLTAMTAQEQATFFKNTSQALKSTPRNGRWSLIKSNLVMEMIHFRQKQSRVRVQKEYLPLSVWACRGFDTTEIKAKGHKVDNPVLGHQ